MKIYHLIRLFLPYPGLVFPIKSQARAVIVAFVADLWHKLMNELGYKTYGAQGGDIGAGISTWLSLKHPESVIGLHLNYISSSYIPLIVETAELSEEVQEFQKYVNKWAAVHSSIRIYHENSKNPFVFKEGDFVKIPVGFAKFPKELPTPTWKKASIFKQRTEMPPVGILRLWNSLIY